MSKPLLFISHIFEEASLAKLIKEQIESDFIGTLNIFVSSDTESISLGSKWSKEIESALATCGIMILLCSGKSVARPWVNFEAGAGWVRELKVLPLCHSGVTVSSLPSPLNMLQAADLLDKKAFDSIYTELASILSCKKPKPPKKAFFNRLSAFVTGYLENQSRGSFEINIAPKYSQSIDKGESLVLSITNSGKTTLPPFFINLKNPKGGNYRLFITAKSGLLLSGQVRDFSLQIVRSGIVNPVYNFFPRDHDGKTLSDDDLKKFIFQLILEDSDDKVLFENGKIGYHLARIIVESCADNGKLKLPWEYWQGLTYP
jgi:hypothetical protein